MSLTAAAARVGRMVRKPPRYVLARALTEAERELDRWRAPRRARDLTADKLLHLAAAPNLDALWQRLAERPFPAMTQGLSALDIDSLDSGESARILQAAEHACNRVVDVLGLGPTALGFPIDWSFDYRVKMGWPRGFARAIDYVNADRPSDVKVPWEISRLQWLIPAGQAYVLTGDERYAVAAREILSEWIAANPLAYSVNWSCTMEAAMRVFTWAWLFHVFARSAAWSDADFRWRFLAALYLHGDFTRRHIEKSDINGNHYTADLAALVMAGLFFGAVGEAPRWAKEGWDGLVAELPRQVFPDGVDFEASCAYHRLVFELFAWPALFRRRLGLEIPEAYLERVQQMARFTASYSRDDGTSPLWGDADDARALPFGGQAMGDHRYVLGIAALGLGAEDLAPVFSGPRSELVWMFGAEHASTLVLHAQASLPSAAFPNGGCYVIRDGGTHVFIDCGPVGLAGRGGHGHNDALSFEAWLEGVPLIVDSGSYVYTASFVARNRFRSTQSHNTPQVDGQEVNRFDPANLWSLSDDAKAVCLDWRIEPDVFFAGAHHGYRSLGIEVRREIRFDRQTRELEISDLLGGAGEHTVTIPLHFAPGVAVEYAGGTVRARSGGRSFAIVASEDWAVVVEPCSVSPSYGVLADAYRAVWRRAGSLPARLTVTIKLD
ncbi:MAG: heparinase II/III family protein [Variibacter sp.]